MTPIFDAIDLDQPARSCEFAPHPVFRGVRMGAVAPSAATAGSFSSHLVQVDPGCSLELHRHPGQDEQHVVLRGSGRLVVDGLAYDYAPGAVAVMPRDHEHGVTAGPDGLLLLATFSPALT